MWWFVCGVLVFWMQAGFAMLEAGCSRDKNVQSILMKNMIDVCVGTLGWFVVGFSFAYSFKKNLQSTPPNPTGYAGGSGDQIIGGKRMYFLVDAEIDYSNFFFQWTFCATAATIVSGGVAERVKFSAYLLYVVVMTTVIYPCIVASTWGGGLFAHKDRKVLDFAGSGIVHLTGGVGALVGAMILGPRTGRFESESEFHPHSMTLVVLGTLILWMGWYGFNCGSGSIAQAGLVACNTTIAAAACACMVFIITLIPGVGVAEKIADKEKIKLDLGGLCNGVLAGLVSITAGCANVLPYEALIIGFIGGIVYVGSDRLLKKNKIDDPLNAFPVHGACGMWGLLAVGFFGKTPEDPEAIVGDPADFPPTYGNPAYLTSERVLPDALLPNIYLILFIWAWCGGISLIVFGGLHKAKDVFGLKEDVLRVSIEDEERGLDTVYHIASAYNSSSKQANHTGNR